MNEREYFCLSKALVGIVHSLLVKAFHKLLLLVVLCFEVWLFSLWLITLSCMVTAAIPYPEVPMSECTYILTVSLLYVCLLSMSKPICQLLVLLMDQTISSVRST